MPTSKKTYFAALLATAAILAGCSGKNAQSTAEDSGWPCFSGIYPHLAYYNSFGECGTGAVVPWGEDLWVITYSPHQPFGSDDKLYQISPELVETVRPESIGGTPANRMIHKPSNQLFIGPYAIDAQANVRVLPYDRVPGRHTGLAAHLTDPENRILLGTMETGFYDVDVHSLEAITINKDGNQKKAEGFKGLLSDLLPGYHGKGFYSGQGVAVYSNNGEEGPLAQVKFDIPSGSLSEWDGKDWKVIRRNQFTEVTGPGGIWGNSNPAEDPIWALGWDYKSVILACREPQTGWTFYRLPKASFAYDGAHGWNTEWPRIRNVGTEENPDYLMTMHGMFWRFPGTFTSANTAGITPRGAYLKVIGDFTAWNGRLVFGCDDSAQSEFLNTRPQKGSIVGAGQSNSNLWFAPMDTPDNVGPTNAGGSVWLSEEVGASAYSDPFLFNGWEKRCAWLANRGTKDAVYTFEVDRDGTGKWEELCKAEVPAGSSQFLAFTPEQSGVWIRVSSDVATKADVMFSFAQKDERGSKPDGIFNGLAKIGKKADSRGLMYALGGNRRSLGLLSRNESGEQYYELDSAMVLAPKEDENTVNYIKDRFEVPENVVEISEGSVLVVDAKGRRWRLPLGNDAYTAAIDNAELRICREVATERDLFSCHGTFYELPAENADGYAKIRPVSSHNFAINDYASYRGLLLMTGTDNGSAGNNPHIVRSEDGKAVLWAGVIDDLWKMGKPVGHGGPWYKEEVQAGQVSDPYLIGFYDRKEMTISHTATYNVTFTIEVDPTGDGRWFHYADFTVSCGQSFRHQLPDAFQARWIRVKADNETCATVRFDYR